MSHARIPSRSVLLPLLLLGACAAGPAEFLRRPDRPIAWPPGDSPRRVEVVMVYGGTDDARRDPGFWTWLAELLTGEREEALVSPYGIAIDAEDTLAVADTARAVVHRISLITGEHEVLRGPEDAPLQLPVGVAFSPDGRLFVTDSGTGRVVVFGADGRPLSTFGDPASIGRPTGIAYDHHADRLLIVDTTGCRLLAYDTSGSRLAESGKRGDRLGEFNYPTNVTVTPTGEVFLTDSMNFRVQHLDQQLRPLDAFGYVGRGPGTFANPKGIAVDSVGHIYVADGLFDNVQVFDRAGRLLLTFGVTGHGFGELSLPAGIMIDGSDRVFVADAGNSRVHVFQFHREPGDRR